MGYGNWKSRAFGNCLYSEHTSHWSWTSKAPGELQAFCNCPQSLTSSLLHDCHLLPLLASPHSPVNFALCLHLRACALPGLVHGSHRILGSFQQFPGELVEGFGILRFCLRPVTDTSTLRPHCGWTTTSQLLIQQDPQSLFLRIKAAGQWNYPITSRIRQKVALLSQTIYLPHLSGPLLDILLFNRICTQSASLKVKAAGKWNWPLHNSKHSCSHTASLAPWSPGVCRR